MTTVEALILLAPYYALIALISAIGIYRTGPKTKVQAALILTTLAESFTAQHLNFSTLANLALLGLASGLGTLQAIHTLRRQPTHSPSRPASRTAAHH